ncbi:MAG TPA: bifunctional dihydropteridine reductase/dihydrofolate reductase TmpR, partial [Deinococcales bacterium]|nr:bifunctional dihydropteridine reductase/dihydrofolate reductase TmpR [Deinococcales bacterium]
EARAHRMNRYTRELLDWAVAAGLTTEGGAEVPDPRPGQEPAGPGSGRRAALVTGSAKGIGRAIALALAGAGFDVGVHYRSSSEAAESVAGDAVRHGARALTLQADVTDPAQAAGLVRRAHEAFGRLDVLVNNVGNYVFKPLTETTDEEWRDMIDSNLSSVFCTMRAAVPIMRAQGSGRIVNIGYAGAQNLLARPSLAPYALAKAGVVVLTRSVAKAEAKHGITANVVAPGVIENSVSQPLKEIPFGRAGREDEVARAVLHFLSNDAAYVTGQVLEVAGGWNL